MMKEKARIHSRRELAEGIVSMWLKCSLADHAEPGQFVLVYPKDSSRLLGRPFCICEVNPEGDEIRIVFRISGKGTEEIAALEYRDIVEVEGPLGKGYPLECAAGKQVLLMGGGIGAPSLLFLAQRLKKSIVSYGGAKNVSALLGYRNSALKRFLADDFLNVGIQTMIATDDGSDGIKGNVVEVAKRLHSQRVLLPQLIYACGPMPMLKAVGEFAAELKIPAYISLEEHMACGVGACLGCVVPTKERDGHSNVHNARICTEGPVFEASEVLW
ncbi:MAG: dihydroorotate dehydrogenase electron transfer subunit [Lachnospiraceae bacterium]|nr:dihydroorotate dehydrogenase electron transfer subunit [Lachnospiraceae bacterium]